MGDTQQGVVPAPNDAPVAPARVGSARVTRAGRLPEVPRGRWGFSGALSPRRRLGGAIAAVAGPMAVTSVGSLLPVEETIGLVLPLYLLVVVVAALVGGLLPALLATGVSTLCVNWFFSPPTGAFLITDPESLLEVIIFLVVAVVVAVLMESNQHGRRVADSLRSTAQDAERLAWDNRARGALLSAVSHDLRTPLAGVKSGISSLRATDITWSPEDREQLLAGVEDSADRLEGLIDNLLDMSRLQTGAVTIWPSTVSLAMVLSRSVGAISAPERVTVEGDADVLVSVDPGLMERVFANLVENALRYHPVAAGPVRVVAEPRGPDVTVSVIDRGPGVPVAEREHIFQPFQRRDDRSTGVGVGLGLAVARGLAEVMHASIRADETPGGGLTMVVTIPVTKEDGL